MRYWILIFLLLVTVANAATSTEEPTLYGNSTHLSYVLGSKKIYAEYNDKAGIVNSYLLYKNYGDENAYAGVKRIEKGNVVSWCSDFKNICWNNKKGYHNQNGQTVEVSDQDAIAAFGAKTPELVQDTTRVNADELSKAQTGKLTPYSQAKIDAAWNQMALATNAKIAEILYGYVDYWLGPFSYGVPAGICGTKMYQKDTTYRKQVNSGFPIPTATYENEMERKLREDLRTVMIEGEKSQLSENLYRYSVNLKMIGDKSRKWEFYLYNSCSGNRSETIDDGMLGHRRVFGMHYADEKMNFDCEKLPYCRFDKACVKIEDEASPRCVSLVHGRGFFSGDC